MALALTEEQQLLKETARDFVSKNAPVTHIRALRDAKDEMGFSPELWREMAQLGWAGMTLDEADGGAGLGYAELGVLMEEAGRTLTPSPLLSTVVLGAECIRRGAPDAKRSEILGAVGRGEKLLALAFEEKPRFAPYAIEAKAEAADAGHRLTGQKTFVLDGHVADLLIVAARTSGAAGDRDGITLFLVDPKGPGVTIDRPIMVDSRNAARVTLDGATSDTVIGEVDRGADILDHAITCGTAALCSEMVGSMQEAFDRTIEYLKTREQFGVKIGTFQALKHRAAEMFAELELARSVAIHLLREIDEDSPDVATLVSVAKARCSDAASLISREMLQMHGGIGMTDEADIGFFLKRARTTELTFGDANYHRNRFAQIQGY